MQLSGVCDNSALAWIGKYAAAYSYQNEAGIQKTILRYTLPFSEEQDAILVYKHKMTPEQRASYYQTLVQGIQRNIAITRLLKNNGVNSILTFDAVEQEREPETGRNNIYIQTEAVQPIWNVLFQREVNILTLLDVFIRLSIIVRDISTDPSSVHHRGICMDEIYLTVDKKIRLGGFYYATAPGYSQAVPYLPDQATHLPPALIDGDVGSAGTDMQTLARMLFNILSGLPWDTQWPELPRIAPAFAPEGLAEILMHGMACTDAECNRFRRRLLDFRKYLSKTALASFMVPVYEPFRKEYSYK